MAALTGLAEPRGTCGSHGNLVASERPATIPGAEIAPPRRTQKPKPGQQTVTEIEDDVDEDVKQSTAADGEFGSSSPDEAADTGQRERSAGRLVELLDRTRDSLGKLDFASDLQLLKRELSRCHDLSKASAGDAIFQSLVTDVESSLASTGWRAISSGQLAVIRENVLSAYRLPKLDVAFLREARARMNAAGIETIPRVDLLSLEIDDDPDDDFSEIPAESA